MQTDFETELCALLNKHSLDSQTKTPDYILAAHLINCLEAFKTAIEIREGWYGRGAGTADHPQTL